MTLGTNNKMKRTLLTVGGILVAITGLLVFRAYILYCGSDWVRTEFATLEDAKAAKAFERGWLPPTLPDGTTNIVEVNDIESNVGQGSFHAPPESLPAYIEELKLRYGVLLTTNDTDVTINFATNKIQWTVVINTVTGYGEYGVGLQR